MSKEQMISLLRERLPLCVKTQSFPVLISPDLPEKQQKNMMKNLSVKEEILAMCDTSLFGRGKNGIAFTRTAAYFKDTLSKVRICRYDKDWTPGTADAGEYFGITPTNPLFDGFLLTDLMDALAGLAAEEGEDASEEQPVAAMQPEPAVCSDTGAEVCEEPDEDDDSDDNDGSLFTSLIELALDITDDPSRE